MDIATRLFAQTVLREEARFRHDAIPLQAGKRYESMSSAREAYHRQIEAYIHPARSLAAPHSKQYDRTSYSSKSTERSSCTLDSTGLTQPINPYICTLYVDKG
jgi:hypothetical protein